MKYILVIAGSDSCGGAGIQADVKTITSLGSHAMTVLTALTAQNSLGVGGILGVPPHFISRQLEVLLSDIRPDAVKIGMIHSRSAVREIAGILREQALRNIVLDPVLAASTGESLLGVGAGALYKKSLISLADVITPNVPEAETLSGIPISGPEDMVTAAKAIQAMGPSVVITGGHLKGAARDLFWDGKSAHWFSDERVNTENTHGSGCVFASALSVFLAEGRETAEAAKMAHDFTRCAIINSYVCGRGSGPVAPGAVFPREAGWRASTAVTRRRLALGGG